MKKIIPFVILGIIAIWGVMTYNNFIELRERGFEKAWANVESAYQRRADLIPNIVNTAKGYAEFEKSTLTDVIEARSKATSMNIDASNISPEQITQFQEAQSGLSGSLSRLMLTFERYPELRANENFQELINELSRTEGQIEVARNRYNDVAGDYNARIQKVPGVIVAKLTGFEKAGLFESEEGAEKAPPVEFDFSK